LILLNAIIVVNLLLWRKTVKKTLIFILLFNLIFSLCVFGEEYVTVTVNGNEIKSDVSAVLVNGRTMLPLRAVLNSLSVPDEDIKWWDLSESVEVTHKGIHIFMAIGVNECFYNGIKYNLDVPAFVRNGRTLVPVRFFGEALGFSVNWIDSERKVEIRSK
jgi:hypothetical protein